MDKNERVELTIRPLADEDVPARYELNRVAFGRTQPLSQVQATLPRIADQAGVNWWGVFDSRGALVADAADREQGQWFGGRLVPASGIAGVAVAPEFRGAGVAQKLLKHMLGAARDRGAVISTLMPSVPGLYRKLGWEQVGAIVDERVATTALQSVRPAAGVTVRRVTVEDFPTVMEVYRAYARAGNGLMERSGPLFKATPAEVLDEYRMTLVEGPDGAEGYASWQRTDNYGPGAKLVVTDLVTLTDRALTTLVAQFGSWGTVAPTTELRLAVPDELTWGLPVHLERASTDAWMLRLVDASAAIAARGWPELRATVDLEIVDDVCPWNAGPHRLVVAAGSASLEPGGSGEVVISSRGLAVLYGGGASTAALRRSDLLHGGDGRTDALLDAAFAGPRPGLLDAF
ncbi:enhanced intracellular survival protein Eis [Allokutzneria sp. NRRL B-24872]|uniref:GNAT family N-acetyltransferase n=1 Tax=Allokutzneria sp. NRRL B-24872 TaxID=1137961 RepID=UPI00143DB0DE|nr:GNAT family N-acetyltransferase [Allokutzneria sp. NRRL B-24872]